MSAPMAPDAAEVSAVILAVVSLFGIVGLLFVIGIQASNPLSAKSWRYPSWSANPFSLSEPLQFFHLAGYFFLAMVLGRVAQLVVTGESVGFELLFPVAFGSGCIVGVHVCTMVFRKKMLPGGDGARAHG